MKAKEYLDQYNSNLKDKPQTEAMTILIKGMVNEIETIMKDRHTTSDIALKAVFREQNDKWNAIHKLDHKFRQDGFKAFVKEKMPNVDVWDD